mmetsp:Transcript_3273/g.4738  ORF Transcript_3273/g.4738 Transcript_3273/m.4738 type:complete len:87 (-) Transcript_3273:195-455(-)
MKLMTPAKNLNLWGSPDPGHPWNNPYFSNVYIPVIGVTKEVGDLLKDHLWYQLVRVQWIEDQYSSVFEHDLEANQSPLSPKKTPGP